MRFHRARARKPASGWSVIDSLIGGRWTLLLLSMQCPACNKEVDSRAIRCPHCTSFIQHEKPHEPLDKIVFTCPHCYTEGLNPRATKCPHCTGDIIPQPTAEEVKAKNDFHKALGQLTVAAGVVGFLILYILWKSGVRF